MRTLASLFLALMAGTANAGVVTFNNYAPLYDFSEASRTVDGFSFTSPCLCLGVDDRPPQDSSGNPLAGAFNGTAYLLYSTDPLSISAVGGGSFFLNQLDLGLSWYAPDSDVGSIVTVSFTRAGGGSGNVTAALGRSFTTVLIGEDVRDVTITGGRSFGYLALDNFVFNEQDNRVPEPASAALALVALGAAGVGRRRRAAAAR